MKSPEVLSDSEIAERLRARPGWALEGGAIARRMAFRDFREAVAFLVLIAFDAEEADHHPDATISYKRVTLALSTHSAGGVTEKDFALAARIDAAAEKLKPQA